jgi:hypothetical protein
VIKKLKSLIEFKIYVFFKLKKKQKKSFLRKLSICPKMWALVIILPLTKFLKDIN